MPTGIKLPFCPDIPTGWEIPPGAFRVLFCIIEMWHFEKLAPSMRAIADKLGLQVSGVKVHVDKLIRRKYVCWPDGKGKSRTLKTLVRFELFPEAFGKIETNLVSIDEESTDANDDANGRNCS